jgi:Protein of unknown function (DUF1097)
MKTQPSFGQWLPVALMIGALAGLTVMITTAVSQMEGFGFIGAVWVIFISWALWFAMGARFDRLAKGVFSTIGGVVFGWLTLVAMVNVFTPLLGDAAGVWALPLTVFCVATTIVLLELTDLFEVGFAYFFSFAGYFAYVFGFAGETSQLMAAVHVSILLVIGFALGIVSSTLKNKILDAEAVPFHLRKTIFDKE